MERHTFWAELKIYIEINNDDFHFIFDNAARHYDFTVRSSTEVGGFLYGLKNRRILSESKDKVCVLSSREFQLITKAIEFNTEERSNKIKTRLWKILHELKSKSKEINKQFENEQKIISDDNY